MSQAYWVELVRQVMMSNMLEHMLHDDEKRIIDQLGGNQTFKHIAKVHQVARRVVSERLKRTSWDFADGFSVRWRPEFETINWISAKATALEGMTLRLGTIRALGNDEPAEWAWGSNATVCPACARLAPYSTVRVDFVGDNDTCDLCRGKSCWRCATTRGTGSTRCMLWTDRPRPAFDTSAGEASGPVPAAGSTLIPRSARSTKFPTHRQRSGGSCSKHCSVNARHSTTRPHGRRRRSFRACCERCPKTTKY